MEFPFSQTRLYFGENPGSKAQIRQQNRFFQVDEVLELDLSGEGEHLYLQIRKEGQNTDWVKQQLAKQLGISSRDIGHAGLKDRHAITSQWLSLHLPDKDPELKELRIEGVEILQQQRHRQKLKPGMHRGNQFRLKLTNVQADHEVIDATLKQIGQIGFPNYFGAQRFGHQGGNLPKAWQLLERRRLKEHKKKSIYLSALRAFLFNRVLDARITEIKDLFGKESVAGNQTITGLNALDGPMWGRGRLNIDPQQAEFEQAVLEPWQTLCQALEYTGLKQERRPLLVVPTELEWSWVETDQLDLTFQLPAGSFATSLLDELAEITDARSSPERLDQNPADE